jgi:hypothetical protein
MAARRFKSLFPKIKLSERARPKRLEDRVAAVESDLRDLRSAIRDLVETLERELMRDLDANQVVGRVGAKGARLKKARLEPPITEPRSRSVRSSQSLPINLP